jgi:hypothetical protein
MEANIMYFTEGEEVRCGAEWDGTPPNNPADCRTCLWNFMCPRNKWKDDDF